MKTLQFIAKEWLNRRNGVKHYSCDIIVDDIIVHSFSNKGFENTYVIEAAKWLINNGYPLTRHYALYALCKELNIKYSYSCTSVNSKKKL